MIRLFFVGIKILMPLPPQEDVPPRPEDQPGVRGLGEAEASHHVAQGRDRAQLLLRARTRQSSTVTSNCHFCRSLQVFEWKIGSHKLKVQGNVSHIFLSEICRLV